MTTSSPIWTPSKERVANSNLKKFIEHINMQGEAIDSFADLYQWSIVENKKFWMEVWDYCDVIGFQGDCIIGEGKPKWQAYTSNRDNLWFPQAELNYAENLLSSAYQNPPNLRLFFVTNVARKTASLGKRCAIKCRLFSNGLSAMA